MNHIYAFSSTECCKKVAPLGISSLPGVTAMLTTLKYYKLIEL